MTSAMLVVRLAGEIVALRADAVESVIALDAVVPVPLAPPHVAGLAALRSRVLTVIDARAALGRPSSEKSAPFEVVVLSSGGHSYGIIVDQVLDVAPADAIGDRLQGTADPAWAAVASGTATIDGRLHLLIDPDRLVAGPGPARAP